MCSATASLFCPLGNYAVLARLCSSRRSSVRLSGKQGKNLVLREFCRTDIEIRDGFESTRSNSFTDTGYKMRVAKCSTETDTHLTLKAISTFLDGALLESNTNHEFCVNLGFPSTETLVQLFSHLENNKLGLGVS